MPPELVSVPSAEDARYARLHTAVSYEWPTRAASDAAADLVVAAACASAACDLAAYNAVIAAAPAAHTQSKQADDEAEALYLDAKAMLARAATVARKTAADAAVKQTECQTASGRLTSEVRAAEEALVASLRAQFTRRGSADDSARGA